MKKDTTFGLEQFIQVTHFSLIHDSFIFNRKFIIGKKFLKLSGIL